MKEIWKDIPGYEGKYQVSNLGLVKSVERKMWNGVGYHFSSDVILNPLDNGHWYKMVALWQNNKQERKYVHRLVAEAFIDNPLNKKEVNHIDGNKENNVAKNLEWNTRKENASHASKNKLLRRHDNHPNAKYSKQDLINIIWMLTLGYKQNQIAKIFECGPNNIAKIKRNEVWADVTL